MSKLLITFLCTISISLTAESQTEVKIDFSNKAVTLPSKDQLKKEGETVQIKIINLPTNNYKVSINKTDSVLSVGTPPTLFGVLSFGDGFNSLLAGLTGYSIRNAGVVMTTPDTKKDGSTKSTKFMALDGGQGELKTTLPVDFFTQSNCEQSVQNIMPTIKAMRKTIFDFHFKFRDEIVKKADNLIYQYNLGTAVPSTFKSDAETLIQKRLQFEREIESDFQTYYDDILPKYDAVTKCIPLATADSMLTAYKKGFSQFLNKFDTTFNETLIAKVYKQLSTPAPSTEFISLPYTIKGDITKFAIDISGIDATKTPQSYNTTIELNKHPNRLWAFTTGVFVSGLKNDEYSILTHVQPNATNPVKVDTLNYSIVKEKNNGVSAGINALMHFGGYFDNSSEVGGFVTFGPGLTLEKSPQVRVMLGAGLLFGRNNKFALSGGWTGGPVKRLSGNYNLQDTYNPAPNDVTRDQFKGNWFASLGYALFGK
jgi:hypothetical protein